MTRGQHALATAFLIQSQVTPVWTHRPSTFQPRELNCRLVMVTRRSAVHILALFPNSIIGTVVRANTNARTVLKMNMLVSPMPAIQGLIVVAMMVAKTFRMKQTPTRASPMIYDGAS